VQENERRKIGCGFQDEIVQALLGINVRLLSLKRGDCSNTEALRNKIASARQLVLRSAKSVRKFARELGSHHQGRRL
jgi:signal transduction histidine kinase